MKKLLIAAVLPLACLAAAACVTPPGGGTFDRAAEGAVAGIELTEAATRLRCPRGILEQVGLSAARLAADAGLQRTLGERITPAYRLRIDAARVETDRVCALLLVPMPLSSG